MFGSALVGPEVQAHSVEQTPLAESAGSTGSPGLAGSVGGIAVAVPAVVGLTPSEEAMTEPAELVDLRLVASLE